MNTEEINAELAELKTKLIKVDLELKTSNAKCQEEKQNLFKINKLRSKIEEQIKHLKDTISTENIFETIKDVKDVELLCQSELIAISNGMDKRDWNITKNGECPRWIDLDRLVKQVIEFKKLYPGWILESIKVAGQYDTMPPFNIYTYTYKTPHGHYMTYGGIEHIN
jgi:hypothetical protein